MARDQNLRTVRILSLVATGLGLLYALYRGYYGLGGTVGIHGVPSSHGQWIFLNRFGAIAILVAAAVPLLALPLWDRRGARPVLLVLFSVAAVGLVMHGLIDEIQRILHLAGLAGRFHIRIRVSGWRSIDMRAADLEDILWNEPWFLTLGLVCGAVVWTVLGPGPGRRWWLVGSLAATAVLVAYGLLAAAGVVGRAIVF